MPEPPSRREFLKSAALAPAVISAAARPAPATGGTAGGDREPEAKLPRVPFGPYSISRLICGANPFNAGSHLSVFVNEEMRRWYTPERIIETLRRCEAAGIDLWQANDRHYELHRRYREEGGRMRYMTLGSAKGPDIAELVEAGCIAVAHHGEYTDQMFKGGSIEAIGDYLKKVKDAGLLAGVSTHMPAVVDAVESKGWDVDFYMTCVYERHRSRADLEKLLGQAPIPVGEVYLSGDPPRMFEAIRATRRPCLAFKILAAGRLSERPEWVEDAFRTTFASIKPSDAVIVGIYDKFSDQAAACAALTRRFGSKGSAGP